MFAQTPCFKAFMKIIVFRRTYILRSLRLGLLINFNVLQLKSGIKRVVNTRLPEGRDINSVIPLCIQTLFPPWLKFHFPHYFN